jgi:FlaA1/EpsC-like NDP-sugar epimerase
MTRFFWEADEAASFILNRQEEVENNIDRGFIYVPKMKSQRLMDIAAKISGNIEIVGMRCPEKIHEELISLVESQTTYFNQDHFIIIPALHEWSDNFVPRGIRVENGFRYTSELK